MTAVQNRYIRAALGIALVGLLFYACHPNGSQYRRWIKDKRPKGIQDGPPNMVYIPSGSYIAGVHELGTSAERNTLPHKVDTISPFYIDRTEVSNLSYLAYLNWLRYGEDEIEWRLALPDTLCWRAPFSYNEPMVRTYMRHPSYRHYPVVGVSWVQAMRYCEWRTGRVNELDSNKPSNYEIRLPTETEWEYAAIASFSSDELSLTNQSNFSIRQRSGFGRGKMMHNFRRRNGDNSGVSHRPNDGADIPSPVYMYRTNDFGLYNIYGNVAEWVSDEYFPITLEDIVPEEDELANLRNDTSKAMEGFVDPNSTFNNILKDYGIENLRDPGSERVSLGQVNRVYKGGSWNDRAYYLQPGVRRFMDERAGSSTIGFRCAASMEEEVEIESGTRVKARVNNSGVGGEIEYYDEEEEDDEYEEEEPEEEPEGESQAEIKARKKAEKEAEKARKQQEKEERKKKKEEEDPDEE